MIQLEQVLVWRQRLRLWRLSGSPRLRTWTAAIFEQVKGVDEACSASAFYKFDRWCFLGDGASEFGLAVEHFDLLVVLGEQFFDEARIDVHNIDVLIFQILV